jgi:serine phosphatase RsbU (regulator of sigma subunit)
MSLRHRLAIGFVLFSALPLAGFAAYSYNASRKAIEAAARSETESALRDLTRRVGLASGEIAEKLNAQELLTSVLAQTDRDRGEVPFAIDPEEQLRVASAADRDRLRQLRALQALRAMPGATGEFSSDEWIVLAREDASSGFRFGIARPIGTAIVDLRAATARNLLLGAALIALMLTGFQPLTGALIDDVRRLERGADAIASGDFDARVDVRRDDEIGKLGSAFNRMAEKIAEHRDRLLAEERRRKEDEISRRLLAAENERRGRELEEARQFQLSMLPRELPRLPNLDLAVEMETATEVGGDYYDFQTTDDGALVLAIGDATGHGAAAGTMVTAVKSLFASAAASQPPPEFLVAANAAIHSMGLTRRAVALSVARVAGRDVELSAAGMPPLLHFRAVDGRVDEITLPGTPLGACASFPYAVAKLTISDGDVLFLFSDGLPELPNADGEPFGYERVQTRFGDLARTGGRAATIVAGLHASMRGWGGDRPPVDDVTLLVLAARDGASRA